MHYLYKLLSFLTITASFNAFAMIAPTQEKQSDQKINALPSQYVSATAVILAGNQQRLLSPEDKQLLCKNSPLFNLFTAADFIDEGEQLTLHFHNIEPGSLKIYLHALKNPQLIATCNDKQLLDLLITHDYLGVVVKDEQKQTRATAFEDALVQSLATALLQNDLDLHNEHSFAQQTMMHVSPHMEQKLCNAIQQLTQAEIKNTKTLSGHSRDVNAVTICPKNKILASASDDRTINVWDINTGSLLGTLYGHTNFVTSVVFSPDGNYLASASHDQTIKLWDIKTQTCWKTLHGHTDFVTSVTCSPDGKYLASASRDRTIKLWDINTHNCWQTLHGHTSYVYAVAFSPDGTSMASASLDNTIKLWDVTTGNCSKTLHGHARQVNAIAFSPDGTLLASASDDNTIKLWDISTGKCLQTLVDHTHFVKRIAFSPNSTLLASASWDNTIKLWDINTESCLQTLSGHKSYVNAVTFSNDGALLASASFDKTIKLWNTVILELLRNKISLHELLTNISRYKKL